MRQLSAPTREFATGAVHHDHAQPRFRPALRRPLGAALARGEACCLGAGAYPCAAPPPAAVAAPPRPQGLLRPSVPASADTYQALCVLLYVPEAAQGSLARGGRYCSTGYAYQPWACRTYRSPWHLTQVPASGGTGDHGRQRQLLVRRDRPAHWQEALPQAGGGIPQVAGAAAVPDPDPGRGPGPGPDTDPGPGPGPGPDPGPDLVLALTLT
eukprot:scaffold87537_cov63-Phaeocystis_antarctica.AAC.3